MMATEVRWLRAHGDEAADNAARGHGNAAGWAKAADRWRREADKLEERLEERKGKR